MGRPKVLRDWPASSTLILVSFRQNKFSLKTACTVSWGLGLGGVEVEGLLPRKSRLAANLSPQVLLKVSLPQSLRHPHLGLPDLEMLEVSPLDVETQVKEMGS